MSRPPRQNGRPGEGAPGGAARPVEVETLYADLTPRHAEVFRVLMRGSSDTKLRQGREFTAPSVS